MYEETPPSSYNYNPIEANDMNKSPPKEENIMSLRKRLYSRLLAFDPARVEKKTAGQNSLTVAEGLRTAGKLDCYAWPEDIGALEI